MEMPEGFFISFQNQKRKMKVPFTIYADFERFVEKIITSQLDPSKAYT